jgi:hypothetical protein
MLVMPVPCSEKSLEEFAASVLDGTAEAEYKSAPIPDEPTDGGVSIIVGKNFDSIVKDADKDVLLEVSGEDHGSVFCHCQMCPEDGK